MKNIGFIAMKEKYPDNYKNITFIFNDVDTLPFTSILNYQTEEGTVKHFYGFEEALGGIVSIKGSDFEKINGYPNFWGWGMEDACLQKRCNRHDIQIDRSQFYPIGSPEILQLFDGVSRLISKKDNTRMITDNGRDGIRTIHNLYYTIDIESTNQKDNHYVIFSNYIRYVNVTNFMTLTKFENEVFFEYDLREPKSKIVFSQDAEVTNKKVVTTNEWKNIPYYPTIEERRNEVKRELMQNMISQQQQQQQQQHFQNIPQGLGIYSSQYAKVMGIKPRATKSVNIGLGGVKY
jgi:hypothetical protein